MTLDELPFFTNPIVTRSNRLSRTNSSNVVHGSENTSSTSSNVIDLDEDEVAVVSETKSNTTTSNNQYKLDDIAKQDQREMNVSENSNNYSTKNNNNIQPNSIVSANLLVEDSDRKSAQLFRLSESSFPNNSTTNTPNSQNLSTRVSAVRSFVSAKSPNNKEDVNDIKTRRASFHPSMLVVPQNNVKSANNNNMNNNNKPNNGANKRPISNDTIQTPKKLRAFGSNLVNVGNNSIKTVKVYQCEEIDTIENPDTTNRVAVDQLLQKARWAHQSHCADIVRGFLQDYYLNQRISRDQFKHLAKQIVEEYMHSLSNEDLKSKSVVLSPQRKQKVYDIAFRKLEAIVIQ